VRIYWQRTEYTLGEYDNEEEAAVVYDRAAFIRFGFAALLNFPTRDYAKETQHLAELPWTEVVTALRPKARAPRPKRTQLSKPEDAHVSPASPQEDPHQPSALGVVIDPQHR